MEAKLIILRTHAFASPLLIAKWRYWMNCR